MLRFIVLAVLLALCSAPAWTKQKPGRGRGHGNSASQAARGFVESDRGAIMAYYGPGGGNLPPGLAKRDGDLPPGLEKQLRRNGTLPPGLQKKLAPFPPELDGRLAPLPPNYQRGTIGHMAVIWDRHRGVIVDILRLR